MVGMTDKALILKSANTVLKISTVESEYPDYQKVLAIGQTTDAKVEKASFLAVLERMAVVSSERHSSVTLEIRSNNIRFKTANPDVGEGVEEIEASCSEKSKVSFNVNYLLDAVRTLKGSSIIIQVGQDKKPTGMKGNDDTLSYTIVMPVQI